MKDKVKELMSKLEPCFGTLSCSDTDIRNALKCPLEPQCANEWLRRHKRDME